MKVSAQKAEIVKLKADGLCFDSIKNAPAENKGDSEQRVISDNYGATYFFVTIQGREKKCLYTPVGVGTPVQTNRERSGENA